MKNGNRKSVLIAGRHLMPFFTGSIWSLQLTLKKLDIDILNRTFSGEVAFKAQDHFGLNIDDVNGGKYFEFLRIFRSWFLLQRYDKFGYKPFITEMNHIRKISGIF